MTYAPPRRSSSIGTGAALVGVDLDIRPGRDHRHRRGDRLGQDHAGPGHGRAGEAGRRPDRLRRHRPRRAARPRAAGVPPQRAGAARVPGPAALARHRPAGGRPGRRAARRRRRPQPGRAPRAGGGGARAGRPGRRLVPRPLPAPALGRPAAAGLAGPGHRHPAAAAVLRRAGQCARRVEPQPGAPAARPAAHRARPGGGDHRPRPELAGGRRRPGRGLLPRPARRARADLRRAGEPGPSLHGAARGLRAERAGRRPALPAAAAGAVRRGAYAGAGRLRVRRPLPVRARRLRRAAAPGAGRRRRTASPPATPPTPGGVPSTPRRKHIS